MDGVSAPLGPSLQGQDIATVSVGSEEVGVEVDEDEIGAHEITELP